MWKEAGIDLFDGPLRHILWETQENLEILRILDYLAEIWNQDLSNTKQDVGYTYSMRTSDFESIGIKQYDTEHVHDICEIKMSQVRAP